jgi:hypothetical protein
VPPPIVALACARARLGVVPARSALGPPNRHPRRFVPPLHPRHRLARAARRLPASSSLRPRQAHLCRRPPTRTMATTTTRRARSLLLQRGPHTRNKEPSPLGFPFD